MKFQDIKVGDSVLCSVSIRYGFNSSVNYLVQKKVTRLTNTQIVIGEQKFYKEDGREVGDSWNQIYLLSEIGTQGRHYRQIEDETQKYMNDVAKVKQISLISKELSKLEKSLQSIPNVLKNISVSDLENTSNLLTSINQKLNPESVETTTSQKG